MQLTSAAIILSLATSQVQMLDEQSLADIRRVTPQLEDRDLQQKLREAIYYDHASLGVAYQAGVGGLANAEPIGFANANFNISLDFPESQKADGAGGNPNTATHFPWQQRPGGTHRSENVDSVTAFWLPSMNGSRLPVVWWRYRVPQIFNPQNTVLAYNWTFPAGTTFFELLFMRAPDGEVYCYEVRVRSRDIDAWIPDVLRPFPEANDLLVAIKQARPRWDEDADLRRLVTHLQSTSNVAEGVLRDGNSTNSAFNVTAGVDTLPRMPYPLAGELLDSTPFRSALGSQWKASAPLAVNAPTTEEDFHIVPKNYDGTFLGNSLESCSRCHNTALTSSRFWDLNIGWYGYVRGNRVREDAGGGILSWHPVEPTTLTNTATEPTMNIRWVNAGILERYDPARHPETYYKRLTP